jgi:hypothetical protein
MKKKTKKQTDTNNTILWDSRKRAGGKGYQFWLAKNRLRVYGLVSRIRKHLHPHPHPAVRDSNEEFFSFSSDSTQNFEFFRKIWIWNSFLCWVPAILGFFREPKMKFRNSPLKREKWSQNQNLITENDARHRVTLGEFSVSSKIN